MNAILISCLALLLITVAVSSQGIEDEFDNLCTSETTCGDCITKSPKCAWCAAENFPRNKRRCDIKRNLKIHNCSDSNISDPKSSQDIETNAEYTSGNKDGAQPVQVRPQKMNFKVRPNEKRKFTLSYQQQQNYPVDLYLLFDKSASIFNPAALDKLKTLGSDIPKGIENITTNFKLGYGSFVDKFVMPYSPWTDKLEKNRCDKERECLTPYVFKNEKSLGVNAEDFHESMSESLKFVSQSFDDTEGGLEALMQVLSCDDNIGWRNLARKIVVYCSNSKFHLSGAGKLGGATKLGESSCKMGTKDLYNNIVNDYPSVSQLASKLSEKSMNVIFAVSEKVQDDYNRLKQFLDEASVGLLETESNNIVELIKKRYDEIRSNVHFKPSNDEDISFKFFSTCNGKTQRKETQECSNFQFGETVHFDVEMTVSSDICAGKTGIVNKQVSIDAVGLSERLTINLDTICECECEKKENTKLNSDLCDGGNGTLECGICNCNDGRYGRHCECDASQISNEEAEKGCRQTNTSEICSGKGECICGVCTCFEIPGTFDIAGTGSAKKEYGGDFCECNNYNCPVNRLRELCGGPSHGSCICGNCDCEPDWSGDDCSCTRDTTTCMAANNKSCNGFGECECGKCQCFTHTAEKMTGPTCEDCLDCVPRCSEYVDCAQCTGFGTGKYANIDTCTAMCGNSAIVDETLPSGEGIRECKGTDVDGCDFFFTYSYTENNDVKIIVNNQDKECPEDAPVVAMVGGTIAAVVLIPLLLIILFVLLKRRADAKEYALFAKEKPNWDSAANPLYENPKSTFQNPTYTGGK